MGLLNLVAKLRGKSSAQEANYLALTITHDRVLALIWTFDEQQKFKILGFGHKSFTNIDVLLHQSAVAIDTAAEEAKVDVTKTVFGLTSDWLEEDGLLAKSSKNLKKLADELELEPQAFVPLAASVIHLLKVEQSPDPKAVEIGIFGTTTDTPYLEVNLIAANKVIATKTSQTPINIEKITKMVSELAKENELPARVVIYGLDESDELAQKITKNDWQAIFTHEPKISFLDDQALARSVAYSQAADILGHEPLNLISRETIEPAEKLHKTNELGFVEGEDILADQYPQGNQVDVSEPEEYAMPQETAVLPSGPQVPAINESDSADQIDQESSIPPPGLLSRILQVFKHPPPVQKVGLFVGLLLVFALVAVFVADQTLTRAEVTILVNAKSQEADFDVIVATGQSTDFAKSQLAGQSQTGQAFDNQKAVTTGSKKVGDPARGEVTIYNWIDSPKLFPKGTGLISKDGMKFNLDKDVEVAPRSAKLPGEAKGPVVAVEVGPSGNLEAGKELNFQEFDEISFSAQNEASFSGGSERQTTVVTQADLDRLEKSLFESVSQKAKEDLVKQLAGTQIQDEAIVFKITKKEFDKKLDDEAALLSLDLQVEAQAITFDEGELKKLLATKITLTENLQTLPENIQITKLITKREDTGLTLTGNSKALLTPKFNDQELKDKIAGQSIKEVRSIVKQIPEVSDIKVNFSPNLLIFSSIPKSADKIIFKIETI